MSAGAHETRLIVHGDDFGLSAAVNRGIAAAHTNGILTSASVLAGGAAFADAVAVTNANPELDIGVHLTLTELTPVADPAEVPSLVDAHGRFAPHAQQFAARYLRGKIELAEVRTELDAQIRRALDYGLPVSHLDGHQHVHMLPGVAHVIADLAQEHGIHAVRHPAERFRLYMLKSPRGFGRVVEQTVLNLLCAVSPLRKLAHAEDFAGFYFGGRLNEQNLLTLLHSLAAAKTTELMCHPGEDDAASDYGHWGYSWSGEVAALSSQRVRDVLQARGVRLISYRDI